MNPCDESVLNLYSDTCRFSMVACEKWKPLNLTTVLCFEYIFGVQGGPESIKSRPRSAEVDSSGPLGSTLSVEEAFSSDLGSTWSVEEACGGDPGSIMGRSGELLWTFWVDLGAPGGAK